MASILALLRGNKGAFIMLFVVTPMAVSLFVNSPRKQRGPVGDDKKMAGRLTDYSAYRRSMDARMVMDFDGEFDSTDSVAQYESSGKELAYDGVAPAKPDWLKGVLRPQDSKKAASAMPLSDAQLKEGLKSARHAGVVSNRKSASMSPAGAALDPLSPASSGGPAGAGGGGPGTPAGIAGGSAVAAGASVGSASGRSTGAGSNPESMVTGGEEIEKAVNAGIDAVENSVHETQLNSETGYKSGGKGMTKGADMRDMEKAAVTVGLVKGGKNLTREDGKGDTKAVLQLTVVRAFSVDAHKQGGDCSQGNCASARDAAGVIFDGSRMYDGSGGTGATVAGSDVGLLKTEAKSTEETVEQCTGGTAEEGAWEAGAMQKVLSAMNKFKSDEETPQKCHNARVDRNKKWKAAELAMAQWKECEARGKYDCQVCSDTGGCWFTCWPCRQGTCLAWRKAIETHTKFFGEWQECDTGCKVAAGAMVDEKCKETITQAEAIDAECKSMGGRTGYSKQADDFKLKCIGWKTDLEAYCGIIETNVKETSAIDESSGACSW